jgi:hypothetical protein
MDKYASLIVDNHVAQAAKRRMLRPALRTEKPREATNRPLLPAITTSGLKART